MKYSKFAMVLLLCFLFLSATTVSAKETKDQVANTQTRTLGQIMVDFIRKILGDEPKPVDDNLVRDEK